MKVLKPTYFLQYRSLNLNNKVIMDRVVKKNIDRIKQWSESFKNFYPDKEDAYKKEIWYCNIPIMNSLIDERCPNKDIKKECIQHMINALIYLKDSKINLGIQDWSKLVCSISIPNTFKSSIDVFFDPEYYSAYFVRNSEEQKWIRIEDPKRSLIQEYNINVPYGNVLKEAGYIDIINDEDLKYKGEIWFIEV